MFGPVRPSGIPETEPAQESGGGSRAVLSVMRHVTVYALAVALAGASVSRAVASEDLDANAFSHADWTSILQKFVDERGNVDYRGLAANRASLDSYVAALAATSPATDPALFPTPDHALAYYINAYNALVFRGVVDRGPEDKSVWRGLVSGLNFFVLMKVEVGGRRMSLKHLEDEIVRAEFQDARVHAALNCASIACPRLPREAFEADRLDGQLDAAMSEFADDRRHVRVDAEKGILWLSKIFDWYEGDFLAAESAGGTKEPSLVDYVNRFRSGSPLSRDLEVRFLAYDKGLNKQ